MEGTKPDNIYFGVVSMIMGGIQIFCLPVIVMISFVAVNKPAVLAMFIVSLVGVVCGVTGLKITKQRKVHALIGLILNGMFFPFWTIGVIEFLIDFLS